MGEAARLTGRTRCGQQGGAAARRFFPPDFRGGYRVGLCRVALAAKGFSLSFPFPQPQTLHNPTHLLPAFPCGLCIPVYGCRLSAKLPIENRLFRLFIGKLSGEPYNPTQPYTTLHNRPEFPAISPLGMGIPPSLERLPRRRLFPFSSLLPSHRRERVS